LPRLGLEAPVVEPVKSDNRYLINIYRGQLLQFVVIFVFMLPLDGEIKLHSFIGRADWIYSEAERR